MLAPGYAPMLLSLFVVIPSVGPFIGRWLHAWTLVTILASMAVAVGAGSVWAGTFEDQKLVRIDPSTNQITGSVTTGGTGAIAVGYGNVWVSTEQATLLRVDPRTLVVATTAAVPNPLKN